MSLFSICSNHYAINYNYTTFYGQPIIWELLDYGLWINQYNMNMHKTTFLIEFQKNISIIILYLLFLSFRALTLMVQGADSVHTFSNVYFLLKTLGLEVINILTFPNLLWIFRENKKMIFGFFTIILGRKKVLADWILSLLKTTSRVKEIKKILKF